MERLDFVDFCYHLEEYDRKSEEESNAEALFRKLYQCRKALIASIESEAFGLGDREARVVYLEAYKDTWADVFKLLDAYLDVYSEDINDIYDILLDIKMEGWSVSDDKSCFDFFMELLETVDLEELLSKRFWLLRRKKNEDKS